MPAHKTLKSVCLDEDWNGYLEPCSTPEENLVTAILERAVSDLFVAEKHVRRETHAWFTSDVEFSICSFIWCLTVLGLEDSIDTIRNKILSLEDFSFRHRRRAIKNSRSHPKGCRGRKFKYSREVIL